MEKNKGVIYILTNPSFPNFVKIGYADNIENRLQQLNRSECIPFAFRVYATYAVDSRLSDLKVHSLIDRLNPDLRSIDNYKGHKRVREFYEMSAEDAYAIFEAMAEIHNCPERLVLYELNEEEAREEKLAKEVEEKGKKRSSNLSFAECQIPIGAVLEFYADSSITCTVVDDRRVEFQGEIMYLTGAARKILKTDSRGIAGPRYFKYKGTALWDIEGRKETP